MARGMGGTQESGLSQKAQLLPSGGGEAQGLVQTPPPQGSFIPLLVCAGCSPMSVAVPSFEPQGIIYIYS